MTNNRTSASRRPVKKGGKFFPALCNILGTLILLLVILVSLPLALPRLLGYEAYAVVSESMEPALPMGSLVYVESAEPDSLEPGEIIAFYSNGVVVTHRVVENHYFYDELITKGDANEANDIKPVPYRDLIGRVRFHMPLVGNYLMFYAGSIGKLYLLGLAFCGVLFNILAGRIRVRQEEQFREQLARYEKSQAARLKAEMEEVSR